MSKIFIVSGPSGSGKTTIIQKLCEKPFMQQRFARTVSYTTRLPRPFEKNGKDYFFVSKSEFESLIRSRSFLEWKQVLGNYYGTPCHFLKEACRKKQHLLLCIDVDGALDIRRKYPDNSILIFIMPPSQKELRNRLLHRTTESRKSLALRLRLAQKEIKMAKKYDYCIINDTLKVSVAALEHICLAEEYRRCDR